MSIQSNVNQIISIASLLASQSPIAKSRKEALNIAGEAKAAERGLKDIESNIASGKFSGDPNTLTAEGKLPYTEEELSSIGKRVGEYREAIYDAKVAKLNPEYRGHMLLSGGAGQERDKLLPQLERIEEARSGALQKIADAKVKAQEAVEASRAQKEASARFQKSFLEGTYSPLTDIRKGGTNG